MYPKRNNEYEVLMLYLGGYSREFYLREISRLTKIPVKSTQNAVKTLEEARIIRSTLKGKNKYFSLNRENIQTRLQILHAEIHKTIIFLSKYPQFKTVLKEMPNVTAVVFGSFSRFTAEKDSDLDVLVIGKDKENVPDQKLPYHLLPYLVH